MRVDWNVTLGVVLCFATGGFAQGHGQSVESTTDPVPVALAGDAAPQVPSRIVERVDEMRVAHLHGNTHPLARGEFDQGKVDPQLPMERMILVLKRSPEQEAALEAFMARQLDPSSPDFHHWLTPEELGRTYGPSDSDISSITSWLQNDGFSVEKVANGRTFIEFSGTAQQVEKAFHTEIHRYNAIGEEHIANNSDPSIPEALSPVVLGVLSLHNFFTKPLHRYAGSSHLESNSGKWVPDDPESVLKPAFGISYSGTTLEWVAPYDFATIYNVLPLWNAGIDGTGQTIAIAGRSNITLSDVATFRSAFGLPANPPTVIVNGPDPGETSTDERLENTVDVEWSGAVAKGATIKLVTTKSTSTTDGAIQSALYIIDNNVAPIMSFSYGACELALGTAGNAAINTMWQEGAAAGITIFVAAGDQGAAGCDGGQTAPYRAQYGLAVSGTSSTPYNVAVGGTDFQWVNLSGSYWSGTNNPTNLSSALGYIPEIPWNATCTSDTILSLTGFTAAGYDAEKACNYLWNAAKHGSTTDTFLLNAVGGPGGKSACTTPSSTTVASCSGGYSKPAWQTGTGVPADSKRDVPDVSLFASNGVLSSAYAFCDSDPAIGPCTYSNSSNAAAQGIGGTSVSSPAMAGIMALVLQKVGSSAQGLANPMLYQLASTENWSSCNSNTVTNGNTCVFYDTTSDNNKVPCKAGSPNCTVNTSGDAVGILSGYVSTTGYDLATGLGSVNAYNLVNAWYTASTAPATMTSPAPGGTLTGASTTFTWTAGPSGTTAYFLWIGSAPGAYDIGNIGTHSTSATVTLPTNGATIYVRLWTQLNGSTYLYNDYTYTEFTQTRATMTSPTPGSTLTGASTTFTWTAGSSGTTGYFLWIGTAPGAYDIGNIGTPSTSATVTLPTNGATIYVRLWTQLNGSTYLYNDYVYTEAP